MRPYRTKQMIVQAEKADRDGDFLTEDGLKLVKKGEYYVKEVSGKLTHLSEKEFNARYEPVADEPRDLEDYIYGLFEGVRRQILRDKERWGMTWRTRPVEGQVDRIMRRLKDYQDQYNHGGNTFPYEKAIGELLIGYVRENFPHSLATDLDTEGYLHLCDCGKKNEIISLEDGAVSYCKQCGQTAKARRLNIGQNPIVFVLELANV